jgi:hypothetical protein
LPLRPEHLAHVGPDLLRCCSLELVDFSREALEKSSFRGLKLLRSSVAPEVGEELLPRCVEIGAEGAVALGISGTGFISLVVASVITTAGGQGQGG